MLKEGLAPDLIARCVGLPEARVKELAGQAQ